MDDKTFRSKPLIAAVLILFVVGGQSFARIAGRAQNEFTKAFQAGKKFYEDGEHKEAALKFFQALTSAKEKSEIGDACLYLALAYYALGEKDDCQLYLKKLFEAYQEKEIEAKYFPVGFVGLFNGAKNEAAQSAKPAAKPIARGDLIPLSGVDVEPKMIKSVNPIYPRSARLLKEWEERQVTLTALISEDGDVLQVQAIKGSDITKPFEAAAEKALMEYKFIPAQKGGVSVRVWKQISFIFKPIRSGDLGERYPKTGPTKSVVFWLSNCSVNFSGDR
jgi:TonB family protein